jgi:hypothetical protein
MSAVPPGGEDKSGQDEKRSVQRARTLLTGKIVYGEVPYSLDCVIRDLTETGARVRVPDPYALPDRLLLLEIRKFVAFETRVKWRKKNEIGLALIRAFSLNDTSHPRNRQLRELAIEAKQRLGG